MDYLDISIQHLNKYVTSEKKVNEIMTSYVEIEEKYDGVKVSIVKHNDELIVSYKSEILYRNEFDYASDNAIKIHSINNSQFKLLFQQLDKVDISKIPNNTEIFVEFLMKKPTLSSNYSKIGGIVIAHSKCNPKIKFGRISTNSTEFNTTEREKYAKILGLNIPRVMFKGHLFDFDKGIIDKNLKSEYNKIKHTFENLDINQRLSAITNLFLNLESNFGGKPEGFVINLNGRLLKINQVYQTDQVARAEIKNKYRSDPEKEDQYWKNVRLSALEIIEKIKSSKLEDKIKEASNLLKDYKITFTHEKKTMFQIKDDIQGNIKMIVIKRLKGNNNFLFLGKMRILTIAHYNIIKNGLKDFDSGVVALVSNKETSKLKDLREKMLRLCFPNIEIIHVSNGNIFSIIHKTKTNINVILAGSDRAQEYRKLISKNPDLSVQEIKRDESAISASAIISNLDNFLFFKRNTPKEIHHLYNEILENKELLLNTKS